MTTADRRRQETHRMNKAPSPTAPIEDGRRQAMRSAARRIDRVTVRLYVGGAIPTGEYRRFLDAGITHLVDVRKDSEVDVDGLVHYSFSISF